MSVEPTILEAIRGLDLCLRRSGQRDPCTSHYIVVGSETHAKLMMELERVGLPVDTGERVKVLGYTVVLCRMSQPTTLRMDGASDERM